MLLTLIVGAINLYAVCACFQILEACREFRIVVKELRDNKSIDGAYWQTLTIHQWLAIKYLAAGFELSYQVLNDRGYNVYPFDWKKHRI